MTNMMTPDEFQMRLETEIEIVKKRLSRTQNRSAFFGAIRRTSNGHSDSLRQKDGYFMRVAGDKWLSKEEYIQIVGLHSFVMREKFLTDDKIELLIRCNNDVFPVLSDLLNRIPDAIEELKVHGSMSVAMMYKQRKYIDTKTEEATRELPQ